MKRIGLVVVCAIALVAAAQDSEAATGYVCRVNWINYGPPSWGPGGMLSFGIYTSPNCGGSYLAWGTMCGKGSDLGNYYCAVSDINNMSEAQLAAYFTALTNAGASGQKVTFNNTYGRSSVTSISFSDW